MAEMEQLAKAWLQIPEEVRLRVPNGKLAEQIFQGAKNGTKNGTTTRGDNL